jgi:hypothetical protein
MDSDTYMHHVSKPTSSQVKSDRNTKSERRGVGIAALFDTCHIFQSELDVVCIHDAIFLAYRTSYSVILN